MIGKIRQNSISIRSGDITDSLADALVVPQFYNSLTSGGVYSAICYSIGYSKAFKTVNDFETALLEHGGELELGDAVLTPSYSDKNWKHLLHVATVGSSKTVKSYGNQYNIVKTGITNALNLAAANNIQMIAAPSLGTGVIGNLSYKESAHAMMAAIYDYSENGSRKIDVEFVIFAGHEIVDIYEDVLFSEDYTKPCKPTAGF